MSHVELKLKSQKGLEFTAYLPAATLSAAVHINDEGQEEVRVWELRDGRHYSIATEPYSVVREKISEASYMYNAMYVNELINAIKKI